MDWTAKQRFMAIKEALYHVFTLSLAQVQTPAFGVSP